MRTNARIVIQILTCFAATVIAANAEGVESEALRLIPFPKEIRTTSGSLALEGEIFIAVTQTDADKFAARQLANEIQSQLKIKAVIKQDLRAPQGRPHCLILGDSAISNIEVESLDLGQASGVEAYSLSVNSRRLLVQSNGEQGLFYGVQTAEQLIRANLKGNAIPSLEIRDWPSLRYRGFQDDITRGPSPHLSTLEREMRLGAEYKMNFFTYYIEHQYAFKTHPVIGPKDGSLTPEELQRLVEASKPYHVEIIGNQQSFGHFYHILKHQEYKDLRETGGIICPVKEDSYKLLDDLYSEQAPLLESKFFNVCCDETHGLGDGPSKELAQEIGVGGVYAKHLRRIHDILKDKYGKRMMMWGDIILRHPENLKEIPKDTVMLTWGYSPAPSFEHQIIPFAKSGYDFFVCPGVNCWSRILPDFSAAMTNIQNFVRDGAKHGAMGMLNTTWDDDGENFFGYNWHGVLWGAECAWNASKTDPAAFNRRIGAVLFGEKSDHFGQAIELLAKTHRIPGYRGMHDSVFWEPLTGHLPVSEKTSRQKAQKLLDLVTQAVEHLNFLKNDHERGAEVNADIIDYFIFGARRMEIMARRTLDFLDAAHDYERAYQLNNDTQQARALIKKTIERLTTLRSDYTQLKGEYARLWHQENKPYALDWTLARFDRAIGFYSKLVDNMTQAAKTLEAGKPLPGPRSVGLELVELGVRMTRPAHIYQTPLTKGAQWSARVQPKRIGIVVDSGGHHRIDAPIELRLNLPGVQGRSCQLFELDEKTKEQSPLLCQLDDPKEEDTKGFLLLSFLIPGDFPRKTERKFYLYFGSSAAPKELSFPGKVSCREDPKGQKWIENDKLRLLLGPEGAHIYRWEVKDADNLDLTQPGETSWAGFLDMGGNHRHSKNKVERLAAGPVLARYRCTDEEGLVKTISLFAGRRWVEVQLNVPVGWFWNYDDPRIMAGDSPTPGDYMFSDGAAGPVGKSADGVPAQVKRVNVTWSAKFLPNKLMLALITPEVRARHLVGPGAGAGGVGIEGSAPAAHFITYGGKLDGPVPEILSRLEKTLDLRDQPRGSLFAVEERQR